MKATHLLITVAPLIVAAPAWSQTADAASDHNVATASPANGDAAAPAKGSADANSAPTEQKAPKKKAFTTGVAKGRDMLDTAISASTLDETDLPKISTASVAGIVGNIPGVRAENPGTDGYTAITIRGLPLAADGSKFVQIEEDGLPVLEFGDIHFATVDQFIRPDITLSQIQAIRGGSASTFASNSPGGVINFISKTGDVPGGAVQVTTGLTDSLYRIDFDYGDQISHDWRFNIGGFYREGSGPRSPGYNAFNGGQLKFNITKQFESGYVRFYAKYLDDSEPNYALYPMAISGTNGSPKFQNLPGLNILKDMVLSQYTASFTGIDQNNQITTVNARNGNRGVVKSVGFETKFDVSHWTTTDKFRYAMISGEYNEALPMIVAPTATIGYLLAGSGATMSYVNGPNAGQTISASTAINGNGLLDLALNIDAKLNNLNNMTNDLRTSRVWDIPGGKLTTTAGLYYSSQNLDMYWDFNTLVEDVAGKNTAFVDVADSTGTLQTQDGVYAWGIGIVGPVPGYHMRYDVNYRIAAPYASVNYHFGDLALGASVRYDNGAVTGTLYGESLGGTRNGTASVDMNGDGTISAAEARVAILPLSQPGDVNYGYHYVSYSVSANYRLQESLSFFSRYSRGARAAADRMLFPPSQNPDTGKLVDPKTAFGFVTQAEGGFKYRTDNLAVYLTGFWASTRDLNYQIGADSSGTVLVYQVDRKYSAKGVELESEYTYGPFGVTFGATYTSATIDSDASDSTLDGNIPRHQPPLIFNLRPQYEDDDFTVGALFNGTTSSYAQDVDLLKQPGYIIVSPFVQYRPTDNMQISLNAFNVFNELAFVQLSASSIPASGLVNAQPLNGRTISLSVRLNF